MLIKYLTLMEFVTSNFRTIIAFIAFILSIFIFFRSNKKDIINAQKFISDRLYDLDKITIDNPKLQQIILKESEREKNNYFETIETIETIETLNEADISLKSFIYLHINFYDELINIFEKDKKIKKFVDYKFWRRFIIYKMENPLFKEIYDNESKFLWGDNFINFIDQNRGKHWLMNEI